MSVVCHSFLVECRWASSCACLVQVTITANSGVQWPLHVQETAFYSAPLIFCPFTQSSFSFGEGCIHVFFRAENSTLTYSLDFQLGFSELTSPTAEQIL